MVKSGVVLCSTSNRDANKRSFKKAEKFLGISSDVRAILSLHRAGIENIIVVLDKDGVGIENRLKADSRIRKAAVNFSFLYLQDYKKSTAKKVIGGLTIVLDSDLLFPHQLISSLKFKPTTKKLHLLLSEAGTYPKNEESCAKQLFVSSVETIFSLLSLLKRKQTLKLDSDIVAKIFPKIEVKLQKSSGLFIHSATYDKKRIIVKTMLNSMRKPTDGFIARNLNRYVSLFLTRYLIKLRLTPNQISVGNLLVGLFAAILIVMGGYLNSLIGAILFQFTSIVDGCDGEVAKLTFSDSKKGAWVDTFCDQMSYLLFFIALPIGLLRNSPEMAEVYGYMGLFIFLAVGAIFYRMISYVKRTDEGGSMLKLITDVQYDADNNKGLNGKISSGVLKMVFIFRRDFFAFVAMLFAVAGLFNILIWILTFFILSMIIFLFLFSNRMYRTKYKR